MTRPIDKDFIFRSYDVLVALAPVLVVCLLAVTFALDVNLLGMLVVGTLAFWLLCALFILTAPLWGLALALLWYAAMLAAMPFYWLWTQIRSTHKAS